MSSPDISAELASEGVPEVLVEVGVYPTFTQGCDHGLAVLAMGHPYWLVPFEGGYRLLVEAGVAGRARDQLARYDRETLNWPPRPIAENVPQRATELTTPLLWSALVLVIFHGQTTNPEWVERGALDARAVFEHGEWWRIGSALFLHGDSAHVLSNALGGIFIFSAVLSTMGRLRGWLLLALAALAGNLLAAHLRYPGDYRSIGASTAIFAAVGLLTGRAIRVALRSHHPHRWRSLLVPFGSGLAILALYGAGGVRVDLLAHFTGFSAGVVAGFAAGARPPAGGGETR